MTTRTRKPRRLTNKEWVLRRWPGAFVAWGEEGLCYIKGPGHLASTWQRTPAQAWADAASRLT